MPLRAPRDEFTATIWDLWSTQRSRDLYQYMFRGYGPTIPSAIDPLEGGGGDGGASFHNDLDGLQGGVKINRYHLTWTEWNELHNWLDDVTLADGGTITTPGDLRVDGGDIGTTSDPDLIGVGTDDTLLVRGILQTYLGSATAPTHSFSSETGLGMYRDASGVLGFTVGGVKQAALSATTLTLVGDLIVTGRTIGPADDTDLLEMTANTATFAGTVAATTLTGANVTSGNDPGHTHSQYFSFTVKSPVAADDFPLLQFPRAVTITAVRGLCLGGTYVRGYLTEYEGDGTTEAHSGSGEVDSTYFQIETTEFNATSGFENPGIAAGGWLRWITDSVSGSVAFLHVTVEYTEA